jgi:ATP-dependent protease HslVU (ClpYQ) peptidase subunit
MTTICAVQYEDRVVIGADSQVTSNHKYWHPRMVKVSERGQYLIAGSGLSAACDIAQHIWTPPTPTATDKKDLYHFMIAKVVPSLKQCFKDNDFKLEDDKDDETRFAFLIAVGGEVFDVADDFAISIDSCGHYAIGSGSSLALGALAHKATIEEALEIAASKDPYTSAPFYFYEQVKRG